MNNMFDYLDWRSDLTFNQVPINEVDMAIFSQLIMIPFSLHIDMPKFGSKDTITLFELGQLLEKYKEEFMNNIGLIIPPQVVKLSIQMSKANRYKDLVLSNYASDICFNKETQFTAFIIDITEEERIVVYSGTDDTLAGWKENFNMMYTYPTQAQIASVKYLKKVSQDKKLYIVGHSKGGNLSIYSTLNISKKIFDNIEKVYSFDAPGISVNLEMDDDIIKRYQKIDGYTPQTSIIGRLFSHKEKDIVVKSKSKGLYQHDLLSWEIEVDHFKREKSRDNDSIYIENKIATMIEKMNPALREEFVEIGYGLLIRTNSQTLSDLNRSKVKLMKQYLNINKEERKILDKTLIELFLDKIVAKNLYFVIKETAEVNKTKKKFFKNEKQKTKSIT